MLILSIDCAGDGCGVCVWKHGSVAAEAREVMLRGQDRRLMPLIVELLAKASVNFENLDRIAVTRGPGSFTGLRIGLAAAQGLGLALHIPVIGIDRFKIYREPFKNNARDQFIVLESRRAELFCRYYPAAKNPLPPQMLTKDEIQGFLKDGKAIITGDANLTGIADCAALTEPEYVIAARLAAAADAADPEFAPRPFYLRAPDVTMPADSAPSALRRLVPGDAEKLAALHAETMAWGAWSAAQMLGSLALDTTRGWAAIENGAIAGFILCQIMDGQSEILALCVHPDRRRKGLAQKLLTAAATAAADREGDLYLEVAADNQPAIRLYDKYGFQRTGKRPGYYQNGKTDAILFALPCQPPNLPRP